MTDLRVGDLITMADIHHEIETFGLRPGEFIAFTVGDGRRFTGGIAADFIDRIGDLPDGQNWIVVQRHHNSLHIERR